MYEWQRQSHHIEIIAVNSGDEDSSITLDRVRSSFVENIFARDIIENLGFTQRLEPDARGFESFQYLHP